MRFAHKILVAAIASIACASGAHAGDWKYGIGLGAGAMKVDGDGGFNTKALGPINFDASLDPDQIQDHLDSGINIAGFASNGDLTFHYSVAALELEADVSAKYDNVKAELDLGFDTLIAELLVEYTFSRSGDHSWGVIGGARYTEQEYDSELRVNNTVVFEGGPEDDWLDGVIGLTHSYAISPTLSWNTQIDYAAGGSEGTAHFNTGISKVLNENWVVSGFVDVKDVEYEEGEAGDADWYYYDATEIAVGAAVAYIF